jgi:hypothetical protein
MTYMSIPTPVELLDANCGGRHEETNSAWNLSIRVGCLDLDRKNTAGDRAGKCRESL